MSYQQKDTRTEYLLKELCPFGGKLNQKNRWLKLAGIIPWEELEGIYKKYFSHLGRPGKDSRLINGLQIIKHTEGLSDEKLIGELEENVYMQYFCGYETFLEEADIDSSSLSKLRKRLGEKYFDKFDREILGVLKKHSIINSKCQMIDATVFPANITHPIDAGLIEKVRLWCIKNIRVLKRVGNIKEKLRTKRDRARKLFISFQKKRRKTKKEIRRAIKKMLRYVGRNLEQIEFLLVEIKKRGREIPKKIKEKLEIALEIYRQQMEMIREKTHRVAHRIVSFHMPHIRPIKRGKSGGKETEFGPKCVLSYVDGYAFLDELEFEAFNEGKEFKRSITKHEERFGEKPEEAIVDGIYANRENRNYVREEGIKATFKPVGRKSKATEKIKNWQREKNRERNQVEGIIGHGKTHFNLERIMYRIKGGEKIWVQMGLAAMNLSTLLKNIAKQPRVVPLSGIKA